MLFIIHAHLIVSFPLDYVFHKEDIISVENHDIFQYLHQCLAYSSCLINICWTNEWKTSIWN